MVDPKGRRIESGSQSERPSAALAKIIHLSSHDTARDAFASLFGTRKDVAEDADAAVLYCHDISDSLSINHTEVEAGFECVERPRNALADVPVHVLTLVDEQVANVFRPARLRFLYQQSTASIVRS